jgi:hypothetical protein
LFTSLGSYLVNKRCFQEVSITSSYILDLGLVESSVNNVGAHIKEICYGKRMSSYNDEKREYDLVDVDFQRLVQASPNVRAFRVE